MTDFNSCLRSDNIFDENMIKFMLDERMTRYDTTCLGYNISQSGDDIILTFGKNKAEFKSFIDQNGLKKYKLVETIKTNENAKQFLHVDKEEMDELFSMYIDHFVKQMKNTRFVVNRTSQTSVTVLDQDQCIFTVKVSEDPEHDFEIFGKFISCDEHTPKKISYIEFWNLDQMFVS
jgi:hypothetical protein